MITFLVATLRLPGRVQTGITGRNHTGIDGREHRNMHPRESPCLPYVRQLEGATLQAFVVDNKPGSVPDQELDVCAAPVNKNEYVS